MKKIAVAFAIAPLMFFSFVRTSIAQGTNAPSPSASALATSGTGGKVVIPPEKSKPVNVPKITVPITIDGRIDEAAWKEAAVFKDFYQTGPGYNTAPSRPTEVYMMYDERHLYVAFKCFDEKDKIRATMAKRDNVFGEDNVRMWIDTYNDRRRAYIFGYNPLGIQQDGIYTEGQGADFSVDVVHDSKGVIEDWGWSVEVMIPFKSIRYKTGKDMQWGFNAARNIDRFNDEFDQWLPEDRDVSGFLVKHGKISGLEDIKYERTLEVVPSITLSQSGEQVSAIEFEAGRFVNRPIKKEIGVNLKYTISPNVTLDAAINPDYAEIEADAPVVTANQRFPIFFQEKRPFFLEAKEIFESPLQPFYSRTIVDPDVAVKLTGKIGKTSFGFLGASDNAPGNYSEDERTRNAQCLVRQQVAFEPCPIDQFLDKNALFGVVRLKRDFGANNNIGFFGTARVFPRNRNFVSGFDGTYKFSSAMVMKFQALGTHSVKNFYNPSMDRTDYRSGNGFGYLWNLDYTKERFGWFAEIFGRTKDYRADSGFTRRTNTNQAFFAFRESTKSDPKATIIRLNFNQFVRYTFDWDNRLQYFLSGFGVNGQFQKSIFVNAEGGFQREKLYEEEFGAMRNNIASGTQGHIRGAFFGDPTRTSNSPYFNWNYNQIINKQLSIYQGAFIALGSFDFDFGGGNRFPRVSPAYIDWFANCRGNASCVDQNRAPAQDPGRGTLMEIWGGFTYKPINPLTTSLDYTKSKLTREDTGFDAYNTNIFTWRTTYQFTRFTYVRARIDYDTLSSRVAGQYLFGWNPNPGTAFYVGYNDILNYNGFNRFTGDLEQGFARTGRTFFIRASYLFRKSF